MRLPVAQAAPGRCHEMMFLCSVGKHNIQYMDKSPYMVIPASRSSFRREADACVSTRLTRANQAPIVACGVSRSFRTHHIDAALGLDSDGVLQSRAWY